jgi:hypothetical protein
MKRIIRAYVLCVAISFACAPLPLLLPGCANPTPQKIAVTTLGSIHQSADAAYMAYIGLVLKGKLSEDGVPQVSEAYRAFQREFAVAVALVKGSTNSSTIPPGLIAAQGRLNETINSVKVKAEK